MKKLLLIWLFALLLIACSRISGKENLETIAEIQLPQGFSVINENYQKSGQDFFFQYDIKFDKDSTLQMVVQIQSSKYYSKQGAQLMYDSVWYVDDNLYKFEARRQDDDKTYHITFNPATGVLNYVEYSQRMRM